MMRKLIPVLILLIGIPAFAEKPTIVDPPRPTEKFKKLLFVSENFKYEGKNYETLTYIFTDAYQIYCDNGIYSCAIEIPEGVNHEYYKQINNELPTPVYYPNVRIFHFLEMKNILFFEARAPRPFEPKSTKVKSSFQKRKVIKPKKARVVFTQK